MLPPPLPNPPVRLYPPSHPLTITVEPNFALPVSSFLQFFHVRHPHHVLSLLDCGREGGMGTTSSEGVFLHLRLFVCLIVLTASVSTPLTVVVAAECPMNTDHFDPSFPCASLPIKVATEDKRSKMNTPKLRHTGRSQGKLNPPQGTMFTCCCAYPLPTSWDTQTDPPRLCCSDTAE